MQTLIRPVVLALGLAGCLLFGGLFALSWIHPTAIEQSAQRLIRAQIEKTTGETIAALDARFLENKARVLMQQRQREIDAVRNTLANGLPARVAAIAAQMGIPECQCRRAYAQRMALKLGTLEQMQAQLDDLIRAQYMKTAAHLMRELRIFSGANALAFALLAAAALRHPGARLQLLPAAATLVAATTIASLTYLFGQNWLHTIVFSSYVGWALVGYIALVFAWLCDLLFNRARCTAQLLSSVGGGVAPC